MDARNPFMRIVARYSFNGGLEAVTSRYPGLLAEVTKAIGLVDSAACKVKESKEKTMPGQMLYAPIELNKEFKKHLFPMGWVAKKEICDYSVAEYVEGYRPGKKSKVAPYREMDFVKQKLGVEVQFGKYSFMVYNVCAKMTIFRNLGHIDTGIEIVPVKSFADEMSTGVSYFEQFVWDLNKRGIADIDVPVLILGIDEHPATGEEKSGGLPEAEFAFKKVN